MLKIYITNLGKYNEGKLIGEWVELPVTEIEFAAVKERIGIDEQYEEYFISDYETDIEGLEIKEYSDIDELNEFTKQFEQLYEGDKKAVQAMLLDGYSSNEALEETDKGNYMIYWNCDNMTDVAYEVIEECGYLNNLPEQIRGYFDYEAFGRDLDIEGKYYNIDGDMVELY